MDLAMSFHFQSCLENTKVEFIFPALEHIYRGVYVQDRYLGSQYSQWRSSQHSQN